MQRSAKLGLQAVEPATRWMAAGARVDSRPGTGLAYASPSGNPASANPKRPLPPHGPPLTHRPVRRDVCKAELNFLSFARSRPRAGIAIGRASRSRRCRSAVANLIYFVCA
jgi:hypothetical protein